MGIHHSPHTHTYGNPHTHGSPAYSGNEYDHEHINQVTLGRARLVLGRVYHTDMYSAAQANSAFYPQRDEK